jgi:hypothetical protein
MYLFEEYLSRRKIDVPYVKHVTHGSLFYRWQDHWRILQIRFVDGGNHPGFYQIRTVEPAGHRYDKFGSDRTGVTLKRIAEAQIYWDQYQDFLLNWCAGLKSSDVAAESSAAKIAAWEICLYCFDSLLSLYANSEDFYNTINLELPPAKRCEFIDRMYLVIRRDERARVHEPMQKFWESEITPMLVNYLDWVGRLVEKTSSD